MDVRSLHAKGAETSGHEAAAETLFIVLSFHFKIKHRNC